MILRPALFTALVGTILSANAMASCLDLLKLPLPNTTITLAESVAAGTYTAPNGQVFTGLPAFCRIAATLTPTTDSNIKIEVWLPTSNWSGRYLGTGNGGPGGAIQYSNLGALSLNDAVANTDMGTSPAATDPAGGLVLIGHPEKQIDFATRSTHLMTVRAKQIIEAFYGESPEHSYFTGCSTGGAQALHEALQFPGDYDGIAAGAPGNNTTHNDGAAKIWNYSAFHSTPVNITGTQLNAISTSILGNCTGKDGGLTSDTFLTDPRDCFWDPGILQCSGSSGAAPTCLSVAQVAAMRKYYQGPINPRTGERIFAGRTLGSEANPAINNPLAIQQASKPNASVPYWVFGADFDWRTFDFDHDVDLIDEEMALRLNANTADLDEFKSRGGKLILYHGFADPQIPTLSTVAYYERLIAGQIPGQGHGEGERSVGLRRTQEFARLYLLPGVGHCQGGAGADTFSPVLAIEHWVETGVAPDRIIASKVVRGVTSFTRPLCPYPALPRYTGVGDPTKAESFACVRDSDLDDNQPPAPKYLNDGDNFPIVPIDDGKQNSGRGKP